MRKLIFLLIFFFWFITPSNAQFSSVSTNIVGLAATNINVAVDFNINRHNTINIPISFNPFKFGDTQWRHIAVQPGWRHWFTERYIGHFISPYLTYAHYNIGTGQNYHSGNAYGIGCSWGYSILLSTRWNFMIEIGASVIYTTYDKRMYDKYIHEFDSEYTYHHRRVYLLPTKCCLSFSYLF